MATPLIPLNLIAIPVGDWASFPPRLILQKPRFLGGNPPFEKPVCDRTV